MTGDLSLPVLPSPSVPPRGRSAAAHLDHEAMEKKEKCAVFGIWNGVKAHAAGSNGTTTPRSDAANITYMGLYALQHRGQESSGIAVTDGLAIHGHTGMGLVPEVFSGLVLAELERRNGGGGSGGAIGHNRYSTAGGSRACNAQPLVETFYGGQVAVAHNGNLINAAAFRDQFGRAGHLFHTTSDTEVIIHLLAAPEQQSAVDPLAATLRRLQGAFSLVFLFPDRIEAARDPHGWRPLVLGELPDGRPVVASETIALDVIAAKYIREVEPGEIVRLDDNGVHSRRFADRADRPAYCVFEHVYFANPASTVFGQNVQIVRESLGARLAAEAPVEADCVMPMPDSGRSAAQGYAVASGIPYREGIVPNRYVGRTFIKPTQGERSAAVRLKLNVIRDIVEGKKLIVVDDSIVRGTTTRLKMQQIRAAGAKEIHLRISCPPIRHPCYFGVDFATRDQLIAHNRSVEEIREFLGVDSLHFLSMEGMLSCVNRDQEHYCTACFSGDYRLDLEHPSTEEGASSQLRMF